MSLEQNLKDKKILFLSVQYFGYEKIISNQLRTYGAHVDYYDERPSNSIFAKGIIRLKRSFYQRTINTYYRRLLELTKVTKYDFLFVIRGEVVPAFFLEELRVLQPGCEFIFYTWDSFTNHTHPLSIQSYFNKRFTFDSNDAVKYDLIFRPLFFIDEYEKLHRSEKGLVKYNLLFLGTAHTDRYKIGNQLMEWCSANKLTSFNYYYMNGRLVFLYKKFFDKSFQKFEYKKLSFNSLNVSEIINLYKESSVILDINHPGQNGLTMRTFEALGAGKKIITTNKEIIKFPFYNENNIGIIDRANPVLDKEFFDTPFVEIDESVLYNMSLSGWLYSIFVESTPGYWIKDVK